MKIPFSIHRKTEEETAESVTVTEETGETTETAEAQETAGIGGNRQDYGDFEVTEEFKEQAISLLIRRRALKKATKKVLLSKRTTLALLLLVLMLLTTCTAAYIQERMGNFTINLNRIDMYRQGIALSDDYEFTEPKARLTADRVKNATNITLEDLPDDIYEIDGQHNGDNYMAYSFYMKNGGKEAIDYYMSIVIEAKSKGVENAARVVVYKPGGEKTVYAAPAKNGGAEPGTVAFYNSDTVCNELVTDFQVGGVDKYCVVVFLEGNDPECVDDIIGGMIRLRMNFDIKDTIEDR